MRLGTLAAATFLATQVAGCLDSIGPFDPKVGGPTGMRCVNDDSDRSVDVSYAMDILPLFQGDKGSPGCGCHLSSSPNPVGIEASGLDLSNYRSLRAGGTNSGGSIVIDGEPCNSVLWQKVSPGPPFGSRMPFDGPFLDDDMSRLISDWIAEGAREN